MVAYELLVGNRVIAGNEKDAERPNQHAEREENDSHKIATLLHTNTLTHNIGRKASGRRATLRLDNR